MKWDTILPIGTIVFVILAGVYFVMAPEAAPTGLYVPIDVGGGEIQVEDQYDMTQVTLSTFLAKGGFITIHESMGEAPARIIGISDFMVEGQHDDVVIALNEEMIPGYKYITILHVDNGDQVYITEDDLPVMVDGAVVRPDFVADPSSEILQIPGTDIELPVGEE